MTYEIISRVLTFYSTRDKERKIFYYFKFLFKSNSIFTAGTVTVYLGLLTYVEGSYTTIRIQMIRREIERYWCKFSILDWVSTVLFEGTKWLAKDIYFKL